MRYFVLLGLVFIIVVAAFLFIGSRIEEARTKRAMRKALSTAKKTRNAVWDEAEHVGDLVVLYMHMVVKHGPDSEEAKAFRFGTDSRLVKSLHGDDASLQAFEQQADIIDQAFEMMKV